MVSTNAVPDSEDSESDVVHIPSSRKAAREPSQPESVLSHRFRESSRKSSSKSKQIRNAQEEDGTIVVMVPAPERPWEYQKLQGDDTVDSILGRSKGPKGWIYKIEYEDGRKEDVSAKHFPKMIGVMKFVSRLHGSYYFMFCLRALSLGLQVVKEPACH